MWEPHGTHSGGGRFFTGGQFRGLISQCQESLRGKPVLPRTFHTLEQVHRQRGWGREWWHRGGQHGELEPNVPMGWAVLGKPGQSWSPWDTALVRVWSSMATSKQISFLLGLIAFLFQIFYVGTRKITIVVRVVHHTRVLHQSEHLSHQRQHRFTYV